MANLASAAGGAAAGSFLGPWGIVAGGLLGGITSFFSGQSEADAINEKIRRAQALAAESLVDSGELSNRLNSIDRMFNQRLTSVLNTTAIRSRGYANSGTIGAAIAGGVEGDRLAARAQTIDTAHSQNKQVKQTIAQMELGTATANPVADIVSGVASGVALGNEVSNFIGNLNFNPGVGGGESPLKGQTTPQPMANAPSQNPYLPKSLAPQEIQSNIDINSVISGVDSILAKTIPQKSASPNTGSGSNQVFPVIGYNNPYEGMTPKLEMMKTYQSQRSQGPQNMQWWQPGINPNHHQSWGY